MKEPVLLVIGLPLLLSAILKPSPENAPEEKWIVTKSDNTLRIFYGSGTHFPQYGALHLHDGYFRLNYGPTSGWGTSVVLFPAFWSGGTYYQGAPITATYLVDGRDLVLSISGTISTTTGSLTASSEVRLLPPVKNVAITAQVAASVAVGGSVPLDDRPGEGFKPVMLSSMHISPTVWDAQAVYAGCRFFPIPQGGWTVQPPAVARVFGLMGGTSAWKTDAPSIEVLLDRSLQITGWVTQGNNPNDDNVGSWAASNEILPSWSYTVIATPEPNIRFASCQVL